MSECVCVRERARSRESAPEKARASLENAHTHTRTNSPYWKRSSDPISCDIFALLSFHTDLRGAGESTFLLPGMQIPCMYDSRKEPIWARPEAMHFNSGHV